MFLDSRLDIWVSEIDPATGLFRSASGRDHRVDTGISQWSSYSNGPEWGLDAKGPALFYVKDNAQGAGQLWSAEPPWDKPRIMQLTIDTDIHHWICEPSVNPSSPSTRVIVYHGKPRATDNVDAWLDEEKPDQLKRFTDRMIVARWAYNTSLITFAYRSRPGQTEPSQVTLVDTDTGKSRIITGDAGNKIDPWLWNAPEFGGELLLCANVDSRALAIYRDVKHDGNPWQRIATLALPPGTPHPTLKSVEPINGGRSAFGRSYFTVQAGDDKDKDTSIWLFGFSPDGHHLIRRLDDGARTGKAARRLDPESYLGERELFVYYNLVGDGPSQLHRCRTGITLQASLPGANSQIFSEKKVAPGVDVAVRPTEGFHLTFAKDYFPGTKDRNGQWSGGTETMELRAHDGKLFASLGYWMDVPYGQPKGDEPWTGAQVLVKDSAAAPWRVDAGFGPGYLRTEALTVVTFTTDAKGALLPAPVKLLVAGPSDINVAGKRWATAWTRDDATGKWAKSEIVLEPRSAGARSFASHRDKVTGIHHIFAGISHGEIYRGVYDPAAPGRLRWHAEPELSGTGRPMSMAEADGVLYAACGIEGTAPQSGGLFRRLDGPQPKWEMVYRWPCNLAARGDEMRILRGLTAIPDPQSGAHEVLFGARNFGNMIERIDPAKDFAATGELNLREFFARLWGVANYRGPTLAAYNRFVPAKDPATGEKVHLIGVAVIHPQADRPPHNGSFFLVRHADGRYEALEIYDPNHPLPAGSGLDGTRAIEVSPFPEDRGRVFYFGGHDCANRNSHNTAWIYKGTLTEKQ